MTINHDCAFDCADETVLGGKSVEMIDKLTWIVLFSWYSRFSGYV